MSLEEAYCVISKITCELIAGKVTGFVRQPVGGGDAQGGFGGK